MSVLFSKALPESTQVLEASGEALVVEVSNPADLDSISWKHASVDEEGDYGDEVDVVCDGVRISREDRPEDGVYSLVFTELVMADDGKYICIAKDKKGEETRVEGDIVIEPLPETARNLIKKKEHKA